MTMTVERLAFALKSVESDQWAKFEQLASSYLASEFPDLRTRASMSGDGGRDAEFFAADIKPRVAIQFSLRKDWSEKIKQTKTRIKETAPETVFLIYVTNLRIGAAADGVKADLLQEGIALDVRDGSWFLDRLHSSPARASAAEDFAREVVDPLLPSPSIETKSQQVLSSTEAETALLFLEMQMLDGQKEYGLTKGSFDSLVRAALRNTTTASRMSRADVHAAVAGFLPQHEAGRLSAQVDGALLRLQRGPVRYRSDGDEFHLRDEERDRLQSSASEVGLLKSEFEEELVEGLTNLSPGTSPARAAELALIGRKCVEAYLMRKGEQFARVVTSEVYVGVDDTTLKNVLAERCSTERVKVSGAEIGLIERALAALLASPGERAAKYISLITDSYTLFSFLQATPDVQKVSQKMFSRADLWLDTSVVLPLLAEIADPEADRVFTRIFRESKSLGIKLRVTPGVVEEVERHINKCRVFVNNAQWRGKVPYLYSRFAFAGKRDASFSGWLENFAGHESPEEDVAEYLWQNHGIEVESVPPFDDISHDLVLHVEEAWRSLHSRRGDDEFEMVSNRLAIHDAENYLNVINSRVTQVGKSALGYTTWWVTLQSSARDILEGIPDDLRREVKGSPVLSVDFLVRYLAMGPRRDQVDGTTLTVGTTYVGDILESLPMDLIAAARAIRAQHSHLEEQVIRRRIRENLNMERAKEGKMDRGGMNSFADLARRTY
ncbi:MAG: hypothetical protein KL785_00825 [Brevundimonas sp.]|nr:hypothetical protein [Brevundimonas sp.]